MKLVMLIALTSGQRCQTLLLLNLDEVEVTATTITFVVSKLTQVWSSLNITMMTNFVSLRH